MRSLPALTRTSRFLHAVLFVSSLGIAGLVNAQGVVPTMGKEFWLGFMKNYQGDPNQSLDVFISSYTNTTGVLEMPLLGLSFPFTVTANVTTTVNVPLTMMHQQSEVLDNKSMVLRTQDTVAVYAINFEQFTADGSVIYPLQSLGDDYRLVAYRGLGGLPELASEFLIVARQDDTEIEIVTTANTVGGQIAGVPFIILLDSGQTYQVLAADALGDFTGTTVKGTDNSGPCRTFAVFSGSVCTNIPDGCGACDHVMEQNLPPQAWGTRYFSVPFETTTRYTYKILADTDGTQVTVNGGVPIPLNAGQSVEVNAFTQAACFEGNQPFMVAQFMEGISCAGNGDPAMLLLNAEEQRIDNVTFATVVSNIITGHYLNVIVQLPDVDDVSLDGTLIPSSEFTPYPNCATVAFASLPLTQGSHTLQCPGGLTAYVYGMGSAESYAYSVGSFTPVPALNLDTVLCLADTNTTITLVIPEPINDPVWTTLSDPNTVLFQGPSFTFTPTASDVYVVTGTAGLSGCEKQFFFSVEIALPPTIDALANGGTVGIETCLLQPVQLDTDVQPPGTYAFSWTPSADLNDPHIQNPIATPAHTTWYMVEVSTLNGCAATQDSVLVTVIAGDVVELTASVDPSVVCAGDPAQLGVLAQQLLQGIDLLDLTPGAIWGNITNGAISNACGSVTGNALYFNGAGQRRAETIDLDVSTGGTIRFAIKIGNGAAPCEDVDPGEDVVLEYSTNGGGAWTIMNTLLEYVYPNFTLVEQAIPGPAQTTSTRFRWRQLANSGAGEDNWSLDDVAIAVNDLGGLTFLWTPPNDLNDPAIATPIATPSASGWYTVTVDDVQFGCTYQDSVFIQVGQAFDILLPDSVSICGGGSIVLDAQPTSGTGHTWLWAPPNGLNATFLQAPTASPTATTTYIVTVTSGEGCVQSDTVTVEVDVPLAVAAIVSNEPICQGSSTQLTAIVNGGQGAYVYSWTPPGSLNDPFSDSPVATPPSTVMYMVVVTDTLCNVSDSAQVLVRVTPALAVDLGEDLLICPGESATLSTGITGSSHLWSTNETTPSIVVSTAGTYWVLVDQNSCTGSDTVVVEVTPDPGDLDFALFICTGDSVYITIPYEGVAYAWDTGDNTRTIGVGEEGIYGFSVTDVYGCTYSGEANVGSDPLGYGVFVPNVFSPNDDGSNDRFELKAGGSSKVAVTVYDRWGNTVFETPSLTKTWDGRINGDNASDGTYFYIVRYQPTCDEKETELRGHVTLLR